MKKMDNITSQLDSSWRILLNDTIHSKWYQDLLLFLDEEYTHKVIYPPKGQIFNAFSFMKPSEVKVVIIGQDPYHQPGQAHGLSFSVNQGVKIPPSLRNIFKEIHSEFASEVLSHNGDLSRWAKQGVLLLNATLTVEYNKAGSHQKIGWEQFTDSVITQLSASQEGIVFILWGAFARKKANLIDSTKHTILQGAHPSPLSANRGGFFGKNYFIDTNRILNIPINWE